MLSPRDGPWNAADMPTTNSAAEAPADSNERLRKAARQIRVATRRHIIVFSFATRGDGQLACHARRSRQSPPRYDGWPRQEKQAAGRLLANQFARRTSTR